MTKTISEPLKTEVGSRKNRLIGNLMTRRTGGPILVLVVLFVGFSIMSTQFGTPANFMNLTRQSSVLLLIALAGTFPIIMGSIDLSVGAIASLAAVSGAVLLRDYESPMMLLLVPLIGACAGAVNGLLIAYAKLPSFMVTLGSMFVFQGVVLYVSEGTPIPVGDLGAFGDFFAGSFLFGFPNIAVFALLVMLAVAAVAKWTRFGRFVYAIGGGESVSTLSGVPVRRVKFLVYLVSGALASVGGILLMLRVQSGSPGIGDPFLLAAVGAIVVGGTPLTGGLGGPHRTLLGVIIMGGLANGMSVAMVHPYLQTVITGAVVVAAVALTIDRSRLSVVK